MNTMLWIVAGGLLGMMIAYVAKTGKQSGIYFKVIMGVSFIILSSYVILPYIRTHAEIARLVLLSALSLCAIGYLTLTNNRRIFR